MRGVFEYSWQCSKALACCLRWRLSWRQRVRRPPFTFSCITASECSFCARWMHVFDCTSCCGRVSAVGEMAENGGSLHEAAECTHAWMHAGTALATLLPSPETVRSEWLTIGTRRTCCSIRSGSAGGGFSASVPADSDETRSCGKHGAIGAQSLLVPWTWTRE